MADFVKQGEKMKASWANQVVTDIRRLQGKTTKKNKFFASAVTTNCPFGTLSLSGANYYIEGGIVYCGANVVNVTNDNLLITSSTPRTKLLYFEIPFVANKDDDSKILLPGIDSTTWTPALEEVDVSTGYPDHTPPTLPSGNGTAIVPLGTLTVPSSGSWIFNAASCGNITLDVCAGVIYIQRGSA